MLSTNKIKVLPQSAATEKRQGQIDVLFLTGNEKISPVIKYLIDENDISWAEIPIDCFEQMTEKLEIIGTVVVDMVAFAESPLELDTIISLLQAHDISTVLLDQFGKFQSYNSPTVSVVKEQDSEEVWGRISANLAYRNRRGDWWRTEIPSDNFKVANNHTEQLQMAGQVQRDFIPKNLPNNEKIQWASFFRPAEWVSGDIYDVVRLDEHHFGFHLTDAVGHSMPAALLTIFLKQAITMRQSGPDGYEIFQPVDVIKNLNARMVEQNLSRCQFATCCYCLLNTENLELTYARAGHPYPILIRPGTEPRQLQATGTLLGVFAEGEFAQETIRLQAGDKIVLYSDGADHIVGKTAPDGQFEFTDQFRSIVESPVEELAKQFGHLVQTEADSAEDFDDITAVALEVL